LMALEAGENDDLPGDYYTQSLIKQYANLLEIDLGSRNLKSEPNSIKEWRRTHAEISSRSQKEAQQRKSVLQGLIRQHPWLMGIVLVVVIWLLVWGAFNDMAGHTKSTFKVPNQVKVVDTTK
ncbi:helix-turn-helix domain-containing protein, partial [Enterococcus faecium]|nr:helix-turn-helix domain-containing protein [Enterococcus faecium]